VPSIRAGRRELAPENGPLVHAFYVRAGSLKRQRTFMSAASTGGLALAGERRQLPVVAGCPITTSLGLPGVMKVHRCHHAADDDNQQDCGTSPDRERYARAGRAADVGCAERLGELSG